MYFFFQFVNFCLTYLEIEFLSQYMLMYIFLMNKFFCHYEMPFLLLIIIFVLSFIIIVYWQYLFPFYFILYFFTLTKLVSLRVTLFNSLVVKGLHLFKDDIDYLGNRVSYFLCENLHFLFPSSVICQWKVLKLFWYMTYVTTLKDLITNLRSSV